MCSYITNCRGVGLLNVSPVDTSLGGCVLFGRKWNSYQAVKMFAILLQIYVNRYFNLFKSTNEPNCKSCKRYHASTHLHAYMPAPTNARTLPGLHANLLRKGKQIGLISLTFVAPVTCLFK